MASAESSTGPATVLDSWSSISEKTVFVLDRSTYFTHVSSGHSISGDCLKESKKTAHLYVNEPTIEPFDRSLWTCTVEAVVGYSRLVWDLFTPDQQCISIFSTSFPDNISKDGEAELKLYEKICGWEDEDQNLDQLMKSLAKKSHKHQIYPPAKLKQTKDISSFPNCDENSLPILQTLEQALNQLSQLTNSQISKKQPSKNRSCISSGYNNGRVILISSFKNHECINKIVAKFENLLKMKNESLIEAIKHASGSSAISQFNQINYCDLVIVNTFPIFDEGPCSKIGNASAFRPFLHSKVFSVKSGRIIAGLLNNLCLQHYNLRSTTITGIPMKEEQNASSSSQYDVEIVHCSSIHEDIMNSGSPLFEGVIEVIDRNGFPCDTFKLSWCTPRSTAIELNHCVATSRITAMDVNSRPSACLTNFLLNGRSVMLEIFKSKSNRITTHILASHNGELYIHSLATMSQKMNIGEPPSVSDQLGGKVGDYRLNEFTAFMKQHTLCQTHLVDDPISKTCNMMKRQTLYWPLTLGHTILLNVPHLLGKLLQLIPKETLSQDDIIECKRTLDDLFKHEKEGQALPSVSIADLLKTSNSRGSGTKLEQLYKLLWNELEYFLRIHSTSPEHEVVLEYLIERHSDKKSESERGTKRATTSKALSIPSKKAKIITPIIPDVGELSPAIQQTLIYYRTGLSLYQTYTQIHNHFNKLRNKLPFVGREPKSVNNDQQQQALRE